MSRSTVVLEAQAQALADANGHPPFLPDFGPEKGRQALGPVGSPCPKDSRDTNH